MPSFENVRCSDTVRLHKRSRLKGSILGHRFGRCSGADGGIGLQTLDAKPPLIIGHRGASGYLPEHTLESYRLAIAQGADVIEPGLISTSDGVLIARQDPNLGISTDVASRPEFAARKRVDWPVDGEIQTGWFAHDFTLAEIKTYADGVGVWKPYIVPMKGRVDSAGQLVDVNGDGKIDLRDAEAQPPTRLVPEAHKHGLFVHVFTFRNEKRQLASSYRGDPQAEYLLFFRLGVDGVFSEFPDTAVTARAILLRER